jgi:hypothetical protein
VKWRPNMPISGLKALHTKGATLSQLARANLTLAG